MKKIVFILSMCAFGVAAHAQQITHAVKANPIGFFAGQYQLGYEHGLTDVISAQVSAGLITGSGEATRLGDPLETVGTTRSGFIVIPEIRVYPGGSAKIRRTMRIGFKKGCNSISQFDHRPAFKRYSAI